ncbi:hypothetical protein [Streptomyces sp. NBC_00576]|uniref:hypothetical protein n=1 Tax=Streptomyces sp. NBC_00576 TaxID=2903665 RepID=UPI002E82458B|nr:hypothetical protein [Streptomyces sp. NBC_00576]WUB72707.1 hypothetical protein OG734_22790 [Streptomyces sp. NBC_00576]
MKRIASAALTTFALTAATVVATTGTATAATGPSCSDAYQIGSTGYITVDGATAASVKQYYSPSCNRNYGYVFVWQSFRDAHAHWFASAGVSTTSDNINHASQGDNNVTEIWSGAASTASACTVGYGFLDVTNANGTSSSGNHQGTGSSSERC